MSLLSSFDDFPLTFEKAEIKSEKRSCTGVFIHVNSNVKDVEGEKLDLPKEIFITEKWQAYTENCSQLSNLLLSCNDKSMLLNMDLLYSSCCGYINDYIFDPITRLVVHFKSRDSRFSKFEHIDVRLLTEEEKKEKLTSVCYTAFEQNVVLPKVIYEEAYSSIELLKDSLEKLSGGSDYAQLVINLFDNTNNNPCSSEKLNPTTASAKDIYEKFKDTVEPLSDDCDGLPEGKYHCVYLDDKGRMFKQR
jgi:hypothetical protein